MKKTYLFYDLETSGLNPCFDQVMQFAAIRTDLSFNELDRIEIFVQLNVDVVPNPIAQITHRISLAKLCTGVNEFEALQRIHAELNQPGTISLGYNTLGFDDEFLRFSFYRNLLAPYTHQYANQCQRMDIYPMAMMYYLFKPEGLVWPEQDGHVSLRLEGLNAANQLASGAAHDALVDVQATLALARRLHQHKDMWDYLTGFFAKQTDLQRQAQLTPCPGLGRQGLLVYGRLGKANAFQAPVLGLGQHQHYKNQTLWLRLDDEKLSASTCNNFKETAWVTQKKTAEPGFLLPMHDRFLQHLTPQRLQIMQHNLAWLQEHPKELAAITAYYQQYTYPKVPNLDSDAALYQSGFLRDDEQTWMAKFHQQSWQQRAASLDHPASNRVYELALRVLGRQRADLLAPKHASTFADYLSHLHDGVACDFRGQTRLSPTQALQEIAALREGQTLDQQQQDLLIELEKSLQPTVS